VIMSSWNDEMIGAEVVAIVLERLKSGA